MRAGWPRALLAASTLLAAAALTVLAARPLAAQVGGSADVTVTFSSGGTASVEAVYLLAPPPPSLELRALLRPCAALGPVRVEVDGAERPLEGDAEGPWLVFPTGALPQADTLRATVRYTVTLQGEPAEIPLVQPDVPIRQSEGGREGAVHVTVRMPDADTRVLFPHMARNTPDGWSARYVAVPSFVRVSSGATGPSPAACAPPAAPAGNGGLVWRFLLLVGIMAAWVPLYLWWAGRDGTEDA